MTVRNPLGVGFSLVSVGFGVGCGEVFAVGLEVLCGIRLITRALVGKGVGFGGDVGSGVWFFFLLFPGFRLRLVGLLVGFGMMVGFPEGGDEVDGCCVGS